MTPATETLMRFRKDFYFTASARAKENRRIEKLIALANDKRIKPRIIVQAETRRRS